MNQLMDMKINLDDAREFSVACDPRSILCDIYVILVGTVKRTIPKLCQRVKPPNSPENSIILEGKLSQGYLIFGRNTIFSEIWTKTCALIESHPDSGQNSMFNPGGRLIIRAPIFQRSCQIRA
jgi:hypothetical protein